MGPERPEMEKSLPRDCWLRKSSQSLSERPETGMEAVIARNSGFRLKTCRKDG